MRIFFSFFLSFCVFWVVLCTLYMFIQVCYSFFFYKIKRLYSSFCRALFTHKQHCTFHFAEWSKKNRFVVLCADCKLYWVRCMAGMHIFMMRFIFISTTPSLLHLFFSFPLPVLVPIVLVAFVFFNMVRAAIFHFPEKQKVKANIES